MKKAATIKGFITGVCVTLALTLSVPALANAVNIGVIFNTFRLRNGSGTVFDWGENLILDDGRTVPSSITYGGESYVSMNRLKELFGDSLQWNGDSSTYTLLETGMQDSYELITEVVKADALGHMWKYQVRRYDVKPSHEGFFHIETNQYYLVVTDDERGYSRAYNLLGPRAYEFTDDCIYFAKYVDHKEVDSSDTILVLTELAYANIPDNQDGKELYEFLSNGEYGYMKISYPYIDSGIMYFFSHHYPIKGSSGNTMHMVPCKNPDSESLYFNTQATCTSQTIDLAKDGYIMFQDVAIYGDGHLGNVYYYKYILNGTGYVYTGISIELTAQEYQEAIKP